MSAHSSERSPRFCQSLLEEGAPAVPSVWMCACVSARARLPANNLTSHGFCFFLNFNEKSADNISLRFSITEAALYHTASPSNSRLLLWIIWTHIWVIY